MTSGIVTAVLLVLFLGGWIWAWSPKRRADFDAAARLPLDDATSPHAPPEPRA
ncbi:cbb3-type cytochrome oxidase subunit 3 [Chiayiivirga flava]|uniref:Cytochrome c oxidase cbb3-type subunit 4 n=1 Tax=Chiayiivirga flava TaxID=659595 RepID=A0A7W8D432_9GAMM|nr:cbb3-type cytochrome c oxidase subunit 3 [Chiayiivirga flava]MBB5207117.1 cytochrome c oxidase cbb3-type subunit 4 [Chiayiivirga flava]